METTRIKPLALGLCLFLINFSAYATGGDWFETTAKLSDSLDMLPGKSLGQIFIETSAVPATDEEVNFEDEAKKAADQLGKEPLPKLLKQADGWIAEARAHHDNTACNLAHDLHDAIAVSDADPAAAREYILWRL